jgi:hypothetical protein
MEMIMNIYSFVETMVGRQYPDVERELMADGFKKGKVVKDRSTGGAKVRFSKGTHEDATIIDVSHAWDIDHYGIGKPGKVTAGNIVDTGARYDNLRSF